MSVKTAEQDRDEQVIRRLYALAEGKSKDTAAFVEVPEQGTASFNSARGLLAAAISWLLRRVTSMTTAD
jgi:hypothetical protein